MHGLLLDTSAAATTAPPTVHWAVVAVGMVLVIYVAFVRPLKNGKRKDPLARGPSDAALARQRAVERDMTALLVEYEQVIRTMSAQFETRVAKLDLLLREADERIAALRAAGAATPTAVTTATAARSTHRPAAFPPAAAAPPAASDDSGAGFDVPPEPPPAADEPARHAEVYALADQGLSYRQIAHELDRAYGEIELILALRPKGGPAAGPPPGAPADEPGGASLPAADRQDAVTASTATAAAVNNDPPRRPAPHKPARRPR